MLVARKMMRAPEALKEGKSLGEAVREWVSKERRTTRIYECPSCMLPMFVVYWAPTFDLSAYASHPVGRNCISISGQKRKQNTETRKVRGATT